jgi:lysophospholipase L1-like esterase
LWDEASYAESFARLIDLLHNYVPEASILVVGPPDRSTVVHRSWKPYEGTEKIIAAQEKVCEKHNCAFWDQRERMGGLGAMQDWVYAGWAQGDHTHFTSEGYRALADAFMLDLMNGFKQYKEHAAGRSVQSAGAGLGNRRREGSGNGRERKNR